MERFANMSTTLFQRALHSPHAHVALTVVSSIYTYILNVLTALFSPLISSGPAMGFLTHLSALVTFLSSNYKPRPKQLVFATIALVLIMMLITRGALEITQTPREKQEAFSTLRKILLSTGGELAGRADD